MRKILLFLLFFNQFQMIAVDERTPFIQYPEWVGVQPPEYEGASEPAAPSCINKKKITATGLVSLFWIAGLASQILPSNELFEPESKAAQFAWLGTAVGSQVILATIALCAIWRK